MSCRSNRWDDGAGNLMLVSTAEEHEWIHPPTQEELNSKLIPILDKRRPVPPAGDRTALLQVSILPRPEWANFIWSSIR